MELITKVISENSKVVFDVENSDHGDSGFQWYYGYLETPDTTHEFSICVMHNSNTQSYSEELTWIDDVPDNAELFEKQIYSVFDWSEINEESEQNQLESEKAFKRSLS